MSERLSLLSGHIDPNSPYSKFEDSSEPFKHIPQSGTVDLENERRKATFDPRAMSIYLHGGEKAAKLREQMMLQMERDPLFRMDNVHDLTRPEVRERVMKRLKSVAHWLGTEAQEDFTSRLCVMILVDPGFMTRLAVHYGLFYNTIASQGTPEQVKYWNEKGAYELNGMVGCFAMTELGHGSNVAGLETTASYDAKTDEFVIHSPTNTSTKWWIGGAAESATHSTVYANLIVNGKNYGVKPFVVPLRNPKTYELLPGVNIGDCGRKMGRNEIDNGWIKFTYVRIPRTNMLMRYTQVKRDGTVTEPPMSQLAYGALLFGRTSIIRESAEMAKKALVIAIRYACVRRQFGGMDGAEKQIMDYKTHQYRLITLLAADYAMQFVGMNIRREYESLIAKMSKADPMSAEMKNLIGNLKEVHGTSAGVKALCTWTVLDLIERCRQTLGGMGYLAYANLSTMYQDHAVQCTWEGDNTVLTLQTGRYLVSCLRDLKEGKKLADGVKYLYLVPKLKDQTLQSNDVGCLNNLQKIFDATCANLVLQAGKVVETNMAKGLKLDEALEKSSAACFVAAKFHCVNHLFSTFKRAVESAPTELKPVLGQLCSLFGLNSVYENSGFFLEFGVLKPNHMRLVDAKILELLDAIRPQVIPLTDSFMLSDFVINSPLGCYDGDVYRRLMDRVIQANPQVPHRYFDRTIKPMIHREPVPRDNIQLDL